MIEECKKLRNVCNKMSKELSWRIKMQGWIYGLGRRFSEDYYFGLVICNATTFTEIGWPIQIPVLFTGDRDSEIKYRY